MAEIDGNLWEYNLARVIVIDVTDDYRLMQRPMPSDLYPVVQELTMPRYLLATQIAESNWANGYLYDWHERPTETREPWYVGVVLATWQES